MAKKIFVDADACPVVKTVERLAMQNKIPCVLVCDTSHSQSSDYSEVVIASKGRDSADFVLLGLVSKGDIVVTHDYGLAGLCLAKGALALSPGGFEYTDSNITEYLTARHLHAKARQAGDKLKGPKKRTNAQNVSFAKVLEYVIKRETENV